VPSSWPYAPALFALGGYLVAVLGDQRRGRRWPAARTVSWCAGTVAALAAVTGPIGRTAHHDFAAHAAGHLLLGMAAPFLLVLGRPVTLTLRALPPRQARRLSRLLRSVPIRVVTHPVTAGLLDAGGLWALYATGLYQRANAEPWLHLLVQVHVLVAGYLFTAAIAGRDPAPHRPGPWTRVGVLVAVAAAHGILAKYLYGHPPAGVPAAPARSGAELMYYGGDVLEVLLSWVFCRRWLGVRPTVRPAAPVSWRLPAGF
jgi:putative membrane protein